MLKLTKQLQDMFKELLDRVTAGILDIWGL